MVGGNMVGSRDHTPGDRELGRSSCRLYGHSALQVVGDQCRDTSLSGGGEQTVFINLVSTFLRLGSFI